MARPQICFIQLPGDEEDNALTAAALGDQDNPPLSDEELARLRPVKPEKVTVTIRLDADIKEAFQSQGKGWQTRMNQALREWLQQH